MNLVVDASVLVGELLRPRGREFLQSPEFRLYTPQKIFEETSYEIRRRATIISHQGRLGKVTEEELLGSAFSIIENFITVIPLSFYVSLETEARKRIPRDPNDWQAVALSLALPAAIWTEDYDFFGCGCPTWTTQTLLIQVRDE